MSYPASEPADVCAAPGNQASGAGNREPGVGPGRGRAGSGSGSAVLPEIPPEGAHTPVRPCGSLFTTRDSLPSDSQIRTPDSQPVTRRREAALRNLEKARAAPRELIYRQTEKRTAACRRNLQKAVEWHRTSRSPSYAPRCQHGAAAADLERSAELAGENPEDYRAHRALFQQGFQPRDARERNLIEGAAQAVWRRLRLLRAERLTEVMRICALLAGLQGAKAERRQHFARQAKRKLAKVILMWTPMRKLHQRIERVFRVLVEPETGAFRFQARRTPMEGDLANRPAAVIGNPWMRAGKFAKRDEAPRELAPVEEWKPWGAPAESGSEGSLALVDPELKAECGLRQAFARQKQEQGRSAEPQTLEEFTKIFLSALAGEAGDDHEGARKLAELVWQRLTLCARRAEEEAQEIELLLTEAATRELDAEGRRELAAKVLSVLVEGEKLLEEADELEQRIERAAEDLAAGRPVNIAPPTPRDAAAGKSVNQLIAMLLEARLRERFGPQRSRVALAEAVRKQQKAAPKSVTSDG